MKHPISDQSLCYSSFVVNLELFGPIKESLALLQWTWRSIEQTSLCMPTANITYAARGFMT